jgi:L-2-hydroxyglutarate oxidase
MLPDLRDADLVRGAAGVRAQAVGRDGRLIDDFLIVEQPRSLHVLNAPSPAATASLPIGNHLADLVLSRL